MFNLPSQPEGAGRFDRQIVSVALAENIPLITSDRKISGSYEGLQVIW